MEIINRQKTANELTGLFPRLHRSIAATFFSQPNVIFARTKLFQHLLILCLPLCVLQAAIVFGKDVVTETLPNHTIPPHSPPSASLTLPDEPTTDDIRRVRLFAEPLIPVGIPSAKENKELAAALTWHANRAASDDFSALEQFVVSHTGSSWTPSLTFDLAMDYYYTGWYSKALATWQKAWPLLKDARDPDAKALADRAVGELAYMYGRLGRMEELSKLLNSIEGRPILGSASEKIAGAKEGLWTMQNSPEVAFRCGPFALDRILASQDPLKGGNSLIRAVKSTTNGCCLREVAALSRQLGMNYQMAYRSKGAPFLIPAVVNWKVGHYAALLREESGLYLLQDITFGNDAWVTRSALESETSGYFLVPPGNLPAGWREISDAEGSKVWGKGSTSTSDNQSTTKYDITVHRLCENGMAVCDAHLMLVSLNIKDSPVGYTPPVGPAVRFLATYNQREASQQAVFNYSTLGQKWTFNWLAFISDGSASFFGDADYYPPGGGILPFTFHSPSSNSAPQLKTQAILTRTSLNSYSMLFPDGSRQIFDIVDHISETPPIRNVLMSAIVDPQGNTNRIIYDSSYRIIAITDAIGQATIFSYYTNFADSYYIAAVTDPFGRSATFTYDNFHRLTNITDSIGLTSQFTYDGGNFIQSMTTAYGTTSFAYGETGVNSGRIRWLETTFPNGEKERVEYTESSKVGTTQTDPVNTVPQGMTPTPTDNYLYYRNTYYWDRRAYPAYATNDYSKARIYHWLHSTMSTTSGILESFVEPLENRVWYNYDGQPSSIYAGTSSRPTFVGRVLDDGTTQLSQFNYNTLGNLTNSVDPVGRAFSFVYATNLTDLLEVRQTTSTNNDLVAKFLYNIQHRPMATWDAAGQMTTNTYNARGQLLTTKNPKGETTTFNYDSNAYLLSIDGPLPGTGDSVGFTYDAVGRVRTVTGTDGYTLTLGYDNFDRVTNIIYPDMAFTAFTYDKLDRVKSRDRMGHETLYGYDSLRQLISVQDPLNRITRFTYCGCGSLASLIDPMGRQTTWEHDIQGRVSAKQYADGSRINYNYENTTSRLKSIEDEKGQFKVFSYNLDNTLSRILYANAQIPTPTVNFTYDTNYNRLISMHDGIGTTTWNYHPAGLLGALRVSEVDGPWPDEAVTYSYDELRRITSRAINGIAESYAYDPLGRVTGVVNALGSFGYAYTGATARVQDVSYPNGQTSHYDYFNNLGDRRLQRITHSKPNSSLISRFTYAYDTVGNITNWMQEMGGLTETWSIGYDNADQLLDVVANQGGTKIINYGYEYDAAANLKFQSINGSSNRFDCNSEASSGVEG